MTLEFQSRSHCLFRELWCGFCRTLRSVVWSTARHLSYSVYRWPSWDLCIILHILKTESLAKEIFTMFNLSLVYKVSSETTDNLCFWLRHPHCWNGRQTFSWKYYYKHWKSEALSAISFMRPWYLGDHRTDINIYKGHTLPYFVALSEEALWRKRSTIFCQISIQIIKLYPGIDWNVLHIYESTNATIERRNLHSITLWMSPTGKMVHIYLPDCKIICITDTDEFERNIQVPFPQAEKKHRETVIR